MATDRLAPFAVVDFPAGSPDRQVAAEFAELAAKLDDVADLGGLSQGHAELALDHLAKARYHTLIALDLQPVHVDAAAVLQEAWS